MIRFPVQVGMLWMIAALLAGPARGQQPLSVSARLIDSPPFYAGQAIEIQVSTVAAVDAPAVAPPRLGGQATLHYLGGRSRLVSESAIGNSVNQRFVHTFRYRLVAPRAGKVDIPPFVLTSGERRGRSEPLQVQVRAVPAAGRPPNFLGGVGAMRVAAEAIPAVIRAGQALEYRLILTGPGARGATIRPTLGRLPGSIKVEDLPDDVQADPPSRVFRYRLRPLEAGEFVLPPVIAASFDPATGRYASQAGPGVRIRVVDVPRFDPETLGPIDPVEGAPSRAAPGPRAWLAGGALAVALPALAWVLLRARARGGGLDARPVAESALAELRAMPAHDGRAVALAVMGHLSDYLAAASGRPHAAITPAEAGVAFARLAGGDAGSADALVAACDRAQFSGGSAPTGDELLGRAIPFFEWLARGEMPGGPRGSDASKATE